MAKSPKSSSHHKMRTSHFLEENKRTVLYLVVVLAVVIWCYFFAKRGDNWWEGGAKTHAPSYGNTEAMVVLIIAVWYFCVVYVNHKMSGHLKDDKEQLMVHFNFLYSSILIAAYFYYVADGRENYETAFFISILLLVGTFSLAFVSYKGHHTLCMALSLLAFVGTIYISLWTYDVFKSSKGI